MKAKRWSKKGRELLSKSPDLFRDGTGKRPQFKGGPHQSDADYKRSKRRAEEKRVQKGNWDD